MAGLQTAVSDEFLTKVYGKQCMESLIGSVSDVLPGHAERRPFRTPQLFVVDKAQDLHSQTAALHLHNETTVTLTADPNQALH